MNIIKKVVMNMDGIVNSRNQKSETKSENRKAKGKAYPLIAHCLSVITFLASCLLPLTFVYGAFEDIGTGARPMALGNAYTAIADDVNALYYNPAGLINLKRKELSATYGLLYMGLGDKSKINNSYVAYGQTITEKIGAMGFSWQQLTLTDLYSERTLTLGYARKMTPSMSFGINFKQLYHEYTSPEGRTDNNAITDLGQSDPVFSQGNSKSNISLDFGYLFRPWRNYSFGMMFQNINEPNMAISETDHDPLRMTIRGGFAYNERRVSIIGDVQTKKSIGNKRDIFFTTAAERWWLNAIFGRADVALRTSVAFGSRDFSQLTAGLSYRVNSLQIDYGFVMPLSGITFGNSQGTHRISLTMRFGKRLSGPEEEAALRAAAEEAAKRAEEELEAAKKESERLMREMEKIRRESDQQVEKIKQESQIWKNELEETRKKSGKEVAVKQLDTRIADKLNEYWKRKFAGATLDERIGILTQILRDFSDTGLDLSLIERELNSTKSEKARAEDDLEVSWNYYNKIAARGATVTEKIRLLSRLIERFARTGIDLTKLETELKVLKAQK